MMTTSFPPFLFDFFLELIDENSSLCYHSDKGLDVRKTRAHHINRTLMTAYTMMHIQFLYLYANTFVLVYQYICTCIPIHLYLYINTFVLVCKYICTYMKIYCTCMQFYLDMYTNVVVLVWKRLCTLSNRLCTCMPTSLYLYKNIFVYLKCLISMASFT